MHISDDHVQRWRRHGYTFVDRFLSADEIVSLQAELMVYFPTWHQYATAPHYFSTSPGGGYEVDAPLMGEQLNLVAAHPDLIDFVERALGTRDVILTLSKCWGKYNTGLEDFEQALHTDYMNNSILYPCPADQPEQVTIIIYYVHVDLDLGPTYVIPRDLAENEPLAPYIRPHRHYPGLYKLERPLLAPAGSIFIYDLRTFHRGSAMLRPMGVRFTHHIAYRRADAPWVGYSSWANFGLCEELQFMIEAATPRQREVFGVPAPGHPYWNVETIAGMASRYPRMDLRPYAEAARVPFGVIGSARERMKRMPTPNDLCSRTGVIKRTGYLRQSIEAMRNYYPSMAFYYEKVLDYYEASSASGDNPAGKR